jgi:hypothetical protein
VLIRGGAVFNTRGSAIEKGWLGGQIGPWRPRRQRKLSSIGSGMRFEGKFQAKEASGVLSFSDCADRYVERHIRRRGLRSGDEMEQRLELLKQRTE